jgi:sterol desaturase/sphingolipid hydroxylase (fatty acid hydroxylase superfamily)
MRGSVNRITNELDAEDKEFGSGWLSGFLALLLSIVGLITVLCFCFPQILTVQEARTFSLDNINAIRLILHLVLVSAFVLALLSAVLRKNPTLGFVAMTIVLLASLMGGSKATMKADFESDIFWGLDFFVLNFLFLGALFIPIERWLKKVNQPILRYEWREDLLYFLISTVFVQALTYLSLNPSLTALAATKSFDSVRTAIASQPVVLQFFEIMFLTDFAQYWFHRTFHKIPWLWKFHAVHHSAQAMDWLAGSRMHIVEVLLMRGFTTLPMYVMGFGEPALYAYIFFVYLMSVFIHANIRIPFGFLQYIIATPRFHHWHHGLEEEAIDVNFAIHFPIIDMVFGTFHMPGERWPDGYGVGGHPVPKGFIRQLLYPFQRDKGPEEDTSQSDSSSE